MIESEKTALSATVLVYNSMSTIQRCIESLRFCDEIVVVDDCSTDGTWEYLQGAEVRFFRKRHTSFAEQRAFARDQAKGEWLLSMDADEYVTPELRDRILQTIGSPGPADGFFIQRRNPYPLGLKGFIWSSHPRLVRTAKCRWMPTDSPHAPLDAGGLRLGKINGAFLDHEPMDSIASQLRKSINRSVLVAQQERHLGKRAGVFRLMLSCLARFAKIFFLKGGWWHGRSGFLYACMASLEAFCKYAYIISAYENRSDHTTDGGPGSYPQPESGKKSYR